MRHKVNYISSQLANSIAKYPKIIMNGVLIEVNKVICHVDFDGDPKYPIILGKSFLITKRARIDIYK